MFKVKIVLVGPSESGKTTIANFLSDATESTAGEYRPTQGVRIVEFEATDLSVKNKLSRAEVELWDCSGDYKFESGWPALARDAHGVIIVYNPEEGPDFRELEILYHYFVDQQGLGPNCCALFSNHKPSPSQEHEYQSTGKLSGTFARIQHYEINLEEHGNRARSDFNQFLSGIVSGVSDRREQEELNIINMRN